MSLPAIRSPRVPAPPHRFDPSPDLAEENTMTIPPDLEAQILRYYHVEKWRVGTIARQLHVHHGTVLRVLSQAGLPRIGPPARRSQVPARYPARRIPRRGAERSPGRKPDHHRSGA